MCITSYRYERWCSASSIFTSFSMRRAASRFVVVQLRVHGFGCASVTHIKNFCTRWVAKCCGMGCLQSEMGCRNIQLWYEPVDHSFFLRCIKNVPVDEKGGKAKVQQQCSFWAEPQDWRWVGMLLFLGTIVSIGDGCYISLWSVASLRGMVWRVKPTHGSLLQVWSPVLGLLFGWLGAALPQECGWFTQAVISRGHWSNRRWSQLTRHFTSAQSKRTQD